jgi:hypothetical protein
MATMSDPSLHRLEELFHKAAGMDPAGARPFWRPGAPATRTSGRRSKSF